MSFHDIVFGGNKCLARNYDKQADLQLPDFICCEVSLLESFEKKCSPLVYISLDITLGNYIYVLLFHHSCIHTVLG